MSDEDHHLSPLPQCFGSTGWCSSLLLHQPGDNTDCQVSGTLPPRRKLLRLVQRKKWRNWAQDFPRGLNVRLSWKGFGCRTCKCFPPSAHALHTSPGRPPTQVMLQAAHPGKCVLQEGISNMFFHFAELRAERRAGGTYMEPPWHRWKTPLICSSLLHVLMLQ